MYVYVSPLPTPNSNGLRLNIPKALAVYQPRIKDRVDQLVAELQSTAGEPKDVTAWMMMLAFDVMGEIGYSKSFDCITTGKEHPAATAIHDHMKIFAIGSMVPWLLNIAGYIPGALAGYKPFFEWCGTMIKEKKSVRIYTPSLTRL
jgi:cytochrome P450